MCLCVCVYFEQVSVRQNVTPCGHTRIHTHPTDTHREMRIKPMQSLSRTEIFMRKFQRVFIFVHFPYSYPRHSATPFSIFILLFIYFFIYCCCEIFARVKNFSCPLCEFFFYLVLALIYIYIYIFFCQLLLWHHAESPQFPQSCSLRFYPCVFIIITQGDPKLFFTLFFQNFKWNLA